MLRHLSQSEAVGGELSAMGLHPLFALAERMAAGVGFGHRRPAGGSGGSRAHGSPAGTRMPPVARPSKERAGVKIAVPTGAKVPAEGAGTDRDTPVVVRPAAGRRSPPWDGLDPARMPSW